MMSARGEPDRRDARHRVPSRRPREGCRISDSGSVREITGSNVTATLPMSWNVQCAAVRNTRGAIKRAGAPEAPVRLVEDDHPDVGVGVGGVLGCLR